MNLTKTEKVVAVILAVLLFIVSLNSTIFFLLKLKVSLGQWLAFNACSPTSFIYLACFLIYLWGKRPGFLVFTALPIYYLGTMSMFVLPWSGNYLIAHIGHIIMTLNLVWACYVVLKNKEYKALGIGLLAGMIIYVPYIAYVITYNQVHAAELAKLFQ
jgi:hypothetical protein